MIVLYLINVGAAIGRPQRKDAERVSYERSGQDVVPFGRPMGAPTMGILFFMEYPFEQWFVLLNEKQGIQPHRQTPKSIYTYIRTILFPGS